MHAISSVGEVVRRSRMYETQPVGGPAGQPPYLNAVVVLVLRAEVEPERLLEELLALEQRFGRVRRVVHEARTLDLDILDVAGVVQDAASLTLPHPRMMERPFVLIPLLDVAPTWRDPRTGTPAADALERLDQGGVRASGHTW